MWPDDHVTAASAACDMSHGGATNAAARDAGTWRDAAANGEPSAGDEKL
jgi:hypothetical protein